MRPCNAFESIAPQRFHIPADGTFVIASLLLHQRKLRWCQTSDGSMLKLRVDCSKPDRTGLIAERTPHVSDAPSRWPMLANGVPLRTSTSPLHPSPRKLKIFPARTLDIGITVATSIDREQERTLSDGHNTNR